MLSQTNVQIVAQIMVSDGAPTKRRRSSSAAAAAGRHGLLDLRTRLPFVSQTALCALVDVALHEDLPTVVHRRFIRKARDEFVQKRTPFGPIHSVIKDAPREEFEVQMPLPMLWEACRVSSGIAHLVSQLPESSVSRKLDLVVYADEITPGNQLSYRNNRRSWGMYWSVYQFGAAALSTEEYTYYSIVGLGRWVILNL